VLSVGLPFELGLFKADCCQRASRNSRQIAVIES